MYEPTPLSPEFQPHISFEEGLRTSLAFADEVSAGKHSISARESIEIDWDEEQGGIRDIRTCVSASEIDKTQKPGARFHVKSLVTNEDRILVHSEAYGWERQFRLAGREEFYFKGLVATPLDILGTFGKHARQYHEAIALLREPESQELRDEPSFIETATQSLIRTLIREPEQLMNSRAFLEQANLNNKLRVDSFRKRFERALVRDLGPDRGHTERSDLNLTTEEVTNAAIAFELAYGFSAGTFSSQHIYKSFGFSKILHQRLSTGRGDEIIAASRTHPRDFAGRYVLAILDAAAQDPNRNAEKTALLRERLTDKPRSVLGGAKLSWTKFAIVADSVMKHPNTQDDKTPQLSLLDPANTRDYGQGFLQLLRLTQTNTDVEIRQLQRDQDAIHAEIIEMLLNGSTKRALGSTALQTTKTDTDR